jgi:hypothetical protein
MSSNAIEQAKAMARQAAEHQTLFVPLALMQTLLAEIERLQEIERRLQPNKNLKEVS